METEKVIAVLEWWSKTANDARGTHSSHGHTSTYSFISAKHKSFPALRDKEDQVRRILKHMLGPKTLPEILTTRTGDRARHRSTIQTS